MVSNPKVQTAFHIFSPTRPPEGDPTLAEWIAEVRAWARLATTEDLGLSDDDWQLFSNGTKERSKK